MSDDLNQILTPEEAKMLENLESDYLNVREAIAFINGYGDAVDREVLWRAYAALTFGMNGASLSGKFDVLFMMKVLAKMLEERTRLAEVLSGNLGESDCPMP